jgi:hypothetical protein
MNFLDHFADREFHTSIATTFGVDFSVYESVVLPRLRGAGCRNNVLLLDGRMLTHALSGECELPRQAGRLYTVSGVDRGPGVFHPKLLLQIGRLRGRLIVSSSNLTTPGLAGNLEIAGTVVYDTPGSGEQRLVVAAWHYLCRHLKRDRQASTDQQSWILARAPWLAEVAPATEPVGLADGTIAALLTTGEASGIGARFVELVDAPVDQLIVISPYWDSNLAALTYLTERLSPGEVSVLIDSARTIFPKRAVQRVTKACVYDRGDFKSGRFIHAKVIIARTKTADHVLIGSSNCTLAALGDATHAGLNEEVCLYRRLPASTVVDALGMAAVLESGRRLDPEALPDNVPAEELPFDQLAALNPGVFECRGDTLSWYPTSAFEPENCAVSLLAADGTTIECHLTELAGSTNTKRFAISDTQQLPAFARIHHADGRISAPAIVMQLDVLRSTTREISSRQVSSLLLKLEGETEASLLILEALAIIERIEQHERIADRSLAIPAKLKEEPDVDSAYKTLSYEQFVAGRRLRSEVNLPCDSVAGSHLSSIRSVLNRIVGIHDRSPEVDYDHPQSQVAFDLGDETGDGQAALNAGDDFGSCVTRHAEEDGQRRSAAIANATKMQILDAVENFRQRIRDRKAAGRLNNSDAMRLRALLMVICTAALPTPTAMQKKGMHCIRKSCLQ